MNPKFVGTLMFVMIAACILTGIIVYPTLPAMAVSHWSASGQANGMLPRVWAASLLPAIMLLIYGLWALIPRVDPLATGFRHFRYVYDFMFYLIITFVAYVYALMLGKDIGWQFDFRTALMPALALFTFIMGSLMPYIHRNWFVGIRTPWTLSSDHVWKKTHEFGGKLFQIVGILMLVATFTTARWSIALVVWPIILAALASVIYSYLAYRKEFKRS